MRIVMLGPFGLAPRMTMRARALQLAKHLHHQGHEVTLLMPPWHTPELAGQCWTEDSVSLRYVELSPATPAIRDMSVASRLYRQTVALRPQVVHVFKPIGHAGAALQMLQGCRRLSRHKVALVVDQDDWEGRGGWSDKQRGTLARRVISWQERWALLHAQAVTVASRELESLAWSLGVAPERVHHLPNGPREWPQGNPEAVRERYALGSAPTVLLYTRFFEFEPARVALAFALVRQAIPEVQFLVVGEGLDKRAEEAFYAHADALALQDAIVRAGWVPEQELPDWFAAANVAIYPFDDTLINRTKCPVKLTDLLYAQVPVVAESVGEIREYIRHRETGMLVPSGEPAALAQATVELLRAPALAASLANNAAHEMRTRYSWSALAGQVAEIYVKACAGQP